MIESIYKCAFVGLSHKYETVVQRGCNPADATSL